MPHLAHMVYFTLTDDGPDAIQRQLDACNKYLSGHDGTVHFSVGTRVPDLSRAVNDDQFHVALNVVFDSRQAHDNYQVSPRHLQFIEENKQHWAEVRVFDSDLA